MASSPFRPGTTVEDQLSFYKAQYEQIELELQEFQASSKDLEAELEKDVEASEKRERKLKEQVEKLGFEVDEWKTKYKQSKDEANRAQTSLQKEITTMRETTRTLQLRLRDIEVANDNYEMQARNTTSSLEDLESKYNVAIERGVMFEEEIRAGEQEREELRIETQRLRDELSDLRVESEITNDKLRRAESTIEGLHSRKPQAMHLNPARPRSIASEVSAVTPPSPSISTPPPSKSEGSGPDLPTPPSPPLSEATMNVKPRVRSNGHAGRKSLFSDGNTNSRSSMTSNRMPRHSRGPSLGATGPTLSSSQKMGPPPRPSNGTEALPRSGSLYQIKGLIGRMQKIEERVHSVRSKLPPSSRNSPRNSPRATTATDNHINVPSSVTVRRSLKRMSISTSGTTNDEEGGDSGRTSTPRLQRLSFGVSERPASAMSQSRPSSRTSNAAADPFVRPSSRISMGRAKTPLVSYPSSQTGVSSRPRSSIGGSYAGTHARQGHASSISGTYSPEKMPVTPTAGRRTTIDKTSIPTPSPHKRTGGVLNGSANGRRTSIEFDKMHNEGMQPPYERPKKLSEVGETF